VEGVNGSKQRLHTVYFYYLGGDHFKYLYLCGGTPQIIKILVIVPQSIDVPTPPSRYFLWKSPDIKWKFYYYLLEIIERHHFPDPWWYSNQFCCWKLLTIP